VKESGKVTRIIGPGLAEVEIKASSACAKCGICHFDQGGTLLIEAKNDIGASAGDAVEIDIPEGNVVLSSLLLFIFPIIAFFTGYLLYGIVLGLFCLMFYLIFLFFYDRKMKTITKITRVV